MPSRAAVADRYVERVIALDPVAATFEGLAGHDAEMTDYSPDGYRERADHERATLEVLARTEPESDGDRIALGVLREQLERGIELFDAEEHFRIVNVLSSPVQWIRQCFDLMPRATEHDWSVIAARLALVPQALDSYRQLLEEGRRRRIVAAQRQAAACAHQAETWGGADPDRVPFFVALAAEYEPSSTGGGGGSAALGARLRDVAARATSAYAAFGRYLVDEYLPDATVRDAVGADRYRLWAGLSCGTTLDLDDTYDWGWDELHRIERDIGLVAERIMGGVPIPEVIEHLERDPTRSIEGVDAFRAWLQDLLDRTVDELDGVHFDIPAPVRRVEAMIAPPGGAAAMYYTGPSEDFSRPGRTWYPTQGRTRFPLWGEVSICYHEGVPGHHLQIGTVRYLADRLDRFQRTLAGCSAHAEGWALYAERLMGELGFLDDPAFELGMLRAQAMRAVRVVVDIGLHLERTIPLDERYAPGARWTPALALPFVIERSHFPPDFMASEVDRYLGLPGQAISYKVGERVWLRCRDDVRRRHGARFDLKAFHAHALGLGPMGLDQLEAELARA